MKPKILIIASYAPSLINFRLHLMQTFIDRGYEVCALAPADKKVEARLRNDGIKFIAINLNRTGLNPFKDLLTCCALYRILKKERPTIMLSYTIKPVIYGSFVARLAGVKQIYAMITGTGFVFNEEKLKNKLIGKVGQLLFKLTLQFNKKVFFQNPDNSAAFLKKKLIKKEQSILINGSGVDTAHFTPTAYPKTFTFLMIARLLIAKGVCEYLEAAKQVKKKYPHIQFLLLGWFDEKNPNGFSRTILQSYIDQKIVRYLGSLEDVRPSLASTSVYVLPSYSEGTPRTVLEAMAMARPIITTDVPGCRETTVDGKNGFLIPPRDIPALVAAMEKFVHNAELVTQMGNESRKIAVQKYDVHDVNEHIFAAMHSLP